VDRQRQAIDGWHAEIAVNAANRRRPAHVPITLSRLPALSPERPTIYRRVPYAIMTLLAETLNHSWSTAVVIICGSFPQKAAISSSVLEARVLNR
jgi:hypothetical protein